ncbi:isopentenyl-diphosphate Delta-isomerase [Georgenia sp. Z1491]|uniref:isopentenyl-diphosphate Delta-isomerase n=1 Tax=Georgenia sp. Z1491 TaxID=3416707 RepID=UPI003CF747E0
MTAGEAGATGEELVVLVDEDGTPVGTAPKAEIHTDATPLHLAFSCYVLDARGRTLLTRRALSKTTWPGVWTNACCGHPGPGETSEDAVVRRMRDELGLEVARVRPLLPDFRYRAVASDGIVENEICPVFVGEVVGDPVPAPDEVEEWAWIEIDDMLTAIAAAPMVFSPWSVLQVEQMRARGVRPAHG